MDWNGEHVHWYRTSLIHLHYTLACSTILYYKDTKLFCTEPDVYWARAEIPRIGKESLNWSSVTRIGMVYIGTELTWIMVNKIAS